MHAWERMGKRVLMMTSCRSCPPCCIRHRSSRLGLRNYTLSSRSQSTKITVRMGQRSFYAKRATAGQVKLLDALELSQDNQGGVSISVGKLGLEKSVELATELLKL